MTDNIYYGEGQAELLKSEMGMRGGRREFASVYVPPKANSGTAEEYNIMLKDAEDCWKD